MMKHALVVTLALAGLSAAQGEQAFTGVITDNECSMADHKAMQMGPTDAECVTACVEAHGASYVLYDGAHVYDLSDQVLPAKFPAQRVSVVGSLDGNKIQVRSIQAAE